MGGEIDVKNKASEKETALAHLVCAVVSIEFGVQNSKIITLKKGSAHHCFARQVAMYLMNVVFQIRIASIARAFGRDPSTVSHACHTIEEARDDMVLDTKLTVLEDFLGAPSLMKTIRDVA